MTRFVLALLLVVATGLAVTGCRAEVDTDSAAIGVAQ
jgi:hypothetical protein